MKPSGKKYVQQCKEIINFFYRIETKSKKLQAQESCEPQKPNAIQTHHCTHIQCKIENPKSNSNKNTSK